LGLRDLATINRYRKVNSLDLSGLHRSHEELIAEIRHALPQL
jgi:hypothetical protein